VSLKKSLGKALVFGVLEVGALCGVPIRPDEIEKIMNVNARIEQVVVLRNEQGDGNDPEIPPP
jgi:hypothetical protein